MGHGQGTCALSRLLQAALKHPTSLPSSEARPPPSQGLWISAQPRGSGHSHVIHTDAHINTYIPAVAIFLRVLFTSQPPLLQFPFNLFYSKLSLQKLLCNTYLSDRALADRKNILNKNLYIFI